MEYVGNVANQALNTAPRPPRPMERVGHAADRIDSINERLLAILARFHGQPESSQAGDNAVTVSYLGNIDRLHANLDVLDKITSELAEVA